MEKRFIVFDGDCLFCNSAALLIAKNDKHGRYTYVPEVSVLGEKLLIDYGAKRLIKTSIVLIDKGMYTKSTAIKKILFNIPKYKWGFYFLSFLPRRLSDFINGV